MMMATRINAGLKFSAALPTVLIALSVCSAAQTSGASHVRRHYIQRYGVVPSSESKKLPRSTVDIGLPTVKLANANAAEVQRLEHATVSQLHSEARSESRASGFGGPRLGDARGRKHSAAINFSYRAPQAGSRGPGSVARRR